MDIETDGFFHKVFRNAKAFSQIPDLATAFCHSLIQIVHRDQLGDGPLVSTILMPLPMINRGINVVEAASYAVAQLMA